MKKWMALLVSLVLLCAAVTALADWTCACGVANDGKFCTECGTAKPADDSWTCACGKTNTSKYCASCGRSQDAANACAACGYTPEDGGAFKFCPRCGATYGASAPAAPVTTPPVAAPVRITSIRDNGEGSATITWQGGYPPYTVYARSYSGTVAQVIIADTYDTSVTTRHLEPYYGHQVWVVGGGTSQEKRYKSDGKMKSFREWMGNTISVQELTLKVNHGSPETVTQFSRAEIERTKASGDPYSWMYAYSLDVAFRYQFTDDHYAMLQIYVTTPGGSILWLGTIEDALLPAGNGCVLPDAVQLYNCLLGDKIETGTYKVSFYDGGLYMTSKEFYIGD